MNILVTGAGGFVGSALVRRLAATIGKDDTIVATDVAFGDDAPLDRVIYVTGPIDDGPHRAKLLDRSFEKVFHFATIAGVQSGDFNLGKRVNLDATLALLEDLARQDRPARLVYSSSIGIFSRPFPEVITDDTPPQPGWSYGTHKFVSELMIADYARAGLVDGIALRFPGILTRPEGSTTMLSAFLNNVFYAARDGRPFTLPLLPQDGTSVMSLRRCLDNVILASTLPGTALPAGRACTLPALFVRMDDLVAALAEVYGPAVSSNINYEPVEAARDMFAGVSIHANVAREMGLIGDASAIDLVRNVISVIPALSPRGALH